VVAIAAAFASNAYFGCYAMMLQGKVYRQIGVDRATGQNVFDIEPAFHMRPAGDIPGVLVPAYWLDRTIRRDWATIEHSDGRKWKNPPPS
jgi:hypothetical protein